LAASTYRPQAVCRLSSEAAIGEAAPARNLPEGRFTELGLSALMTSAT